jgi:hypothetical protein
VRLFWWNGSALGNADIGIYSLAGGKIYSSGSTVQSGASQQPQFVTPSTPILLAPGSYFLAHSNDGTLNRTAAATTTAAAGRLAGAFEQASAFPLPTSLTVAVCTGTIWPLVGLTRKASGG